MTKVLTPEAQADRDEFDATFANSGCACHISPPCNFCVHAGNPDNQAEDEDAWMEDDEDEICSGCSGSGEGMHDGSNCYKCHGSGVEPRERQDDDC
jgi:DnaJ-class molecular chaperone